MKMFFCLQLSSLAFLLLCHYALSAKSFEKEQKAILDTIFHGYDSRIRPEGENGTGPVIVTMNIYVRSISNIDDSKMEYDTQLTVRQSWKDERLKYDDKKNFTYLAMTSPYKLWTPDIFFTNEKSGHFHNILMPNVLVRIYPDGTVLFSIRITLKLSSPMDLQYFPFDNQVCPVILASYGYATNDLIFLWKRTDSVQVTKNLHLAKFTLNSFFTDYCISKTNTGEYSCLKVDFQFSRNLSYYLARIYIPTIAIVFLSFITFWLHSQLTTTRLTIWMGSLISLIIINTSAGNFIPEISYTTALDVWMGICICFIFGVLLELCLVINMNEKCEQSDTSSEQIAEEKVASRLFRYTAVPLRWLNKFSTKVQRTDAISRVMFPAAFVIFNFIYWLTYAT